MYSDFAFFPNTFSTLTLLFFSFPLSFLPAHSMLVSLKKNVEIGKIPALGDYPFLLD